MTNRTVTFDSLFNLLLRILASLKDFFVFVFSQNTTWYVLVAFVLLIFAYQVRKRYRKRKESRLTYQVEQVLKKSCKQKKSSVIIDFFNQLYLPSWKSFSFVFVIALVLFAICHIDPYSIFPKRLKYIEGNHYQNLIAIHAGVGAIIFALLIFVAESLREDETKDRARVLVKESFLFPLTVAEIIGFFVFVWGDVNFWAVLPLMIVATLTIISLYRLLSVLLSKSRFSKKRLELLQDRIKKSIGLAISERFGNSVLVQSLGEGKIELQYNPFSSDADKDDTHSFYSDKLGVITDIRLDKLDEFAKLVEREANKNGFSFYKNKPQGEGASGVVGGPVNETKVNYFQHADGQSLHRKFRDQIDEENQVLISIEKRTVGDQGIKELAELVKEIFIIRNEDNFSQEIKLELDGLKDQFVTSIEGKKPGKIEELARTYVSLAETFLESLNECSGAYSYEQAQTERTALMGGWNEIRWLYDHIREIYIKASQTHDSETIKKVLYLPIAIATKAVKAGDQYVYQEFLTFPAFLYWLALKEDDLDTRKFMVDRSWRYLKELSDYHIEYELRRKVKDLESIKKYTDFTIPILAAFQTLIKTAFENKDFESFQTFIDRLSSLYDHYDFHDRDSAESLRFKLQWTTDEAEKQSLQSQIDIQEAKEKAVIEIHLKRQQVIFGLSAWILEAFRNKPTDEETAKFYFDIAEKLSNSLPELTEVYVSSRQFETERFWGWDNWEIIPDAGVQAIDFHSKLDRLYCVHALRILEKVPEPSIKSITLPSSRDISYLAEDKVDSHSLVHILTDIASNPSQWSFVLSHEAAERVPKLKELLTKAKEVQEKNEEEYLISAQIDSSKLEEFKKSVTESFYESCYLRPVLKLFGSYNDLTRETPDKKITNWGYTRLDDKAAFIRDWHVHYSGWGENYGRGMASSEDEMIFKAMIETAGSKTSVTKQDVIPEIERITKERQFKDPVILQTLSQLFEYESVRKSEAFISRYRRDCPKRDLDNTPGYMGILKLATGQIPVIDIFIRKDDLKNQVLVIDLSIFGVLNQYSPINNPEDTQYLYDIFLLRIIDLNADEQRRQKLIDENPWLQERTDREAYLRQRVLINLFQRLDFKTKNAFAAHVISVTDIPTVDSEVD